MLFCDQAASSVRHRIIHISYIQLTSAAVRIEVGSASTETSKFSSPCRCCCRARRQPELEVFGAEVKIREAQFIKLYYGGNWTREQHLNTAFEYSMLPRPPICLVVIMVARAGRTAAGCKCNIH